MPSSFYLNFVFPLFFSFQVFADDLSDVPVSGDEEEGGEGYTHHDEEEGGEEYTPHAEDDDFVMDADYLAEQEAAAAAAEAEAEAASQVSS